MADIGAVVQTNDLGSEVLPTALQYYYEAYTAGGTVHYYQRLYSSSVAGWCYYTKTTVDPNPLSTETTPNHGGTIVAGTHSILWRL